MSEHILLRTAVRTPYKPHPDIPEGASYDAARGFWVYRGFPWVESRSEMPFTKKADIETGEDQKGE